ncbi:MAG: UDP-N-acetylglucosamine 1-carboxyvinyltransferase [Clostridia bacterium]|nr:UDP-N-acetylglucosamine 1-carboxyvinyltransferase [Clostridia bacterium]
METFHIKGQKPLYGTVAVSGSKNAALPILAASLLTDKPVILERMPALSDIKVMCDILSALGCSVASGAEDTLIIETAGLSRHKLPYDLTGRLRGSFLVMGPLLARCGRVAISLPGGCAIGARPVDLHLKGLSALGATFKITKGIIEGTAKKLVGTKIYLDFPSVGATENIMSAAVLAEGTTIIENAATEPEIVDLANFLCSMGGRILGAGSNTVKIIGVAGLTGTRYAIMPDRIEAGTLLTAAAITGGQVTVTGIRPDTLKPITAKFSEMNIPITIQNNTVTVEPRKTMRAVDIKTLPFPGFPTDMQAPMTALLSLSEGTGIITETVFENRFMHTGELCRMGASIKVSGRNAVIEGKKSLSGAKVKATDLRAGAALVLAGLAARGDTEISDIYHIDRGYDALEKKLQSLGAEIERKP